MLSELTIGSRSPVGACPGQCLMAMFLYDFACSATCWWRRPDNSILPGCAMLRLRLKIGVWAQQGSFAALLCYVGVAFQYSSIYAWNSRKLPAHVVRTSRDWGAPRSLRRWPT
jgi:hypothetical protein